MKKRVIRAFAAQIEMFYKEKPSIIRKRRAMDKKRIATRRAKR
jgi:hypothetical protein